METLRTDRTWPAADNELVRTTAPRHWAGGTTDDSVVCPRHSGWRVLRDPSRQL